MKTSIFAALVGVAFANNFEIEEKFTEWLAYHGKSYGTVAEFKFRLEQFTKAENDMSEWRARNPSALSTVSHNQFSDWTAEEKRQGLRNYKPNKSEITEQEAVDYSSNGIPKSVDWRKDGAVNPIRDQGQCGSCWAFSAIAALEGHHYVKHGHLYDLSEQQCVDCDTESFGCDGGWQDNCFWYVYDNGGISKESDYPYRANTGACWADWNGPVAVKGVNYVRSYSEDALVSAIAKGVTSVTVESANTAWDYYSGGILDDVEGCKCEDGLDHAVAAVGYGTENGVDFYIVRNSWGTGWGENGYIRLRRIGDGYGMCGVQEISVYPTVI